VKNLGAEKSQIKAMIDVEALGLGTPRSRWKTATKASRRRSPPSRSRWALPSRVPTTIWLRIATARPFQSAKIPVLSVHSLALLTARVPNTDQDNRRRAHDNYYAELLQLVAAYLAYLDESLN